MTFSLLSILPDDFGNKVSAALGNIIGPCVTWANNGDPVIPEVATQFQRGTIKSNLPL